MFHLHEVNQGLCQKILSLPLHPKSTNPKKKIEEINISIFNHGFKWCLSQLRMHSAFNRTETVVETRNLDSQGMRNLKRFRLLIFLLRVYLELLVFIPADPSI